MTPTVTVKADAKGRLTIPNWLRQDLGIKPGDMFFLRADVQSRVLHFAKAENPFDVLAEHALGEYRAGRTRSLRDIAAEHGIDLVTE